MKLIKKEIKITDLKPGDMVTVKSYKEILLTLDFRNCYDNTYFAKKMIHMCDKDHEVVKVFNYRTNFCVSLKGHIDIWDFRAPWLKNIIE